jgi:hypothetical protein
MKRTINLAKRNVIDLEQDGLSQLSRDAIVRRRERVVLREIRSTITTKNRSPCSFFSIRPADAPPV